MIKIMLVDDMQQILDYFTLLINNEPGMEVVATANSGKEAVRKACSTEIDIILMDIQMETPTAGIEAMCKIKQQNPDVKFVINTIHDDDENIINAYSCGASDYMIKSAPATEIIRIIRENYQPTSRTMIHKCLSNKLVRMQDERSSLLFAVNSLIRLTPSELQVLKLIYNGKTYGEVARIKCVEEVTIRAFINKILKKMEAKNMKSLIKNLRDLRIIELLEIPE